MAALLIVFAAQLACADRSAERAEAERVRAAEEAARAKARAEIVAAAEAERLKALWTYLDKPDRGKQVTAALFSTNDVDTGAGADRVQLIFRDHSAWGRSSYLVLRGGDFDCSPRCTVAVTKDTDPPAKMAARRPQTDEAIAMFINDWRMLWNLTKGAERIAIEFPVQAGGTRTATFDVGGLDPAKMPWGE